MKKLTIIVVAILSYLITFNVYALPDSPWNNVSDSSSKTIQFQQRNSFDKVSLKARTLILNHDQFKNQLVKTPTLVARSTSSQNFTIPLPSGEEVEVIAKASSVMHPELAKQFPDIQTWRVRGAVDTAIQGRVSFSNHGFYAMLIMPDGDTVFVEPEFNSDQGNKYLSFSKAANSINFNTSFQCSVHSNHYQTTNNSLVSKSLARPASSLITYRLAVAATGEYTQFHGGTRQSALSAIVTTIDRVNEIYERDLGITFQLVAEELDIIYTNPASDPYTNADGEELINENIQNLTVANALNQTKFDIGHVFSTGAGGLAIFEAACSNFAKAGGATGVANPIGDAFSIDFVAHELGHQLGANHTFNSETGNCGGGNRAGGGAVEPGSGSTIMAYAGLCNDNNIQGNSDAVFHAISIAQILRYTRNVNQLGSSCGVRTPVSNEEPIPNAGSDNVIPANTPFILSGTAADPDSGDTLSYSWEQNDKGTVSDVNVDTGDNAIIRSFLPNSSGTRYIPLLSDLFLGRRLRAEKLPETSRDLNFVLTVRDGEGGFEFDNLLLTVIDTGRAFQVTSHTVESTLEVGQETQVSWDVAGTDSSPISCSAVDIGLIQSNGSHLDVLQQTPNDGAEIVMIPDNAFGMSEARFIVNCSDSETTFFNISSAALRIVAIGGPSSSGGGIFDSYLLLLLLLLTCLKLEVIMKSTLKKKEYVS